MKRLGLIATAMCLLLDGLAGCASPSGSAINVYVTPEHGSVRRVAVLPFRASTEIIGASVSDMFVTEILRTQRYELIERSQLSGVLGEAEVQLSGLSTGQAAQLGQLAGADAVIIGTVSEYETMAHRGKTLPVVGLSVRMIDSATGRILWSVDHAARGARGVTLAQHARSVVHEITLALQKQIR